MGKQPLPLKEFIKKLLYRRKTEMKAANFPAPPMDIEDLGQEKLGASLAANLARFKAVLGDPGDLIIREFWVGWGKQIRAGLLYIDGLVDKGFASDNILQALAFETRMVPPHEVLPQDAYQEIKDRAITAGEVRESQEMAALINSLLSGDSILLLEGFAQALVISTKGWSKRGVQEPETEKVVRGPREGFTETLRDNTALLRRKIRTPRLRMEMLKIGRVSQTDVVVVYLEGIAPPKLVDEVRTRLKRINIDAILESGYLEDFIEDSPYSPFPQIYHTERPDVVAGDLLEGKVAVLVDGTPFALTMPATLDSLLQSPEDYYDRPHIVVLLRSLRYLSLFLALTLPSFYIAIVSFHQEMLPTPLAISIAAGKEGVPFPVIFEALVLEVALEVLREASIRLPSGIGQPVSIVGALIIGQAAVQAGLVGPAIVIVVAVTAIASFTIPSFSAAIALRLLRFPFMILAAVMGMWGIVWGLTLLLLHLVSLRSFGVPYLSPFAPLQTSDLKDTFFRLHWWSMKTRPRIGYLNRVRVGANQKPAPPPHQPSAEEVKKNEDKGGGGNSAGQN